MKTTIAFPNQILVRGIIHLEGINITYYVLEDLNRILRIRTLRKSVVL